MIVINYIHTFHTKPNRRREGVVGETVGFPTGFVQGNRRFPGFSDTILDI